MKCKNGCGFKGDHEEMHQHVKSRRGGPRGACMWPVVEFAWPSGVVWRFRMPPPLDLDGLGQHRATLERGK
jgi:hypothetical protein